MSEALRFGSTVALVYSLSDRGKHVRESAVFCPKQEQTSHLLLGSSGYLCIFPQAVELCSHARGKTWEKSPLLWKGCPVRGGRGQNAALPTSSPFTALLESHGLRRATALSFGHQALPHALGEDPFWGRLF